MFIGASNELGEFESGVAAAFIGVVRAIALGGALACVAAVVWARVFPSLSALDRLDAARAT